MSATIVTLEDADLDRLARQHRRAEGLQRAVGREIDALSEPFLGSACDEARMDLIAATRTLFTVEAITKDLSLGDTPISPKMDVHEVMARFDRDLDDVGRTLEHARRAGR